MRWDNLFEDLQGQLEHELALEDADLRAEEERMRLGRLTLRDRIAAIIRSGDASARVRITLACGDRIRIVLAACGRDWIAGEFASEFSSDGPRCGRPRQCVIPISSISAIDVDRSALMLSLDARSSAQRALSERLGLNFVLRDMCRRRGQVEVWQRSERIHGTIDRVGRDHLDLAIHEAGSQRREAMISGYRMVPFADVSLVLVL